MKEMKERRKLKDGIVIVGVLLISVSIVSLITQKPSFLFGIGSKSYQEKFVANYLNNIPDGWQIVNIENLGLISIPETLEVREDGSGLDVLSKNFNETIYEISGLTEPNTDSSLVIQQKGLDDFESSAFSSYARIMINIYNLESEELPARSEKLNLSEYDLELLRDQSVATIEEAAEYFNCSLGAVTIEETYVNRMNAIKVTYSRSCRENPEVYVQQYKFFNSDQIVEIILSYRTEEENKWPEDFSRIMNTFILTN